MESGSLGARSETPSLPASPTPGLIAGILFLSLAIFHTWPIARSPGGVAMAHGDAQLNAWILSWIPHALRTNPAHLFDGNIFAPEPRTLAYSEPLIVPALAGSPVRALGGSAVLTFNLVMLAGLVATAWMTWYVVTKWTGSWAAGLVSGTLATFNVHILTRLAHVAAVQAWSLPLILYVTDRLIDPPDGRPRGRDAIVLALAVAATALTSIYLVAFAVLLIVVVAICARWRVARLATIGAGAIAGLALAAPLLWPYVLLAGSGATRSLEMVAQFSATPAGYLATTGRLEAGLTRSFFTNDVNVFFAGVCAIALAGVGMVALFRGHAIDRRRALMLAALAAAGVLLSFGPATIVYRALYAMVPPLHGLRAAARFGYLYLLAIAVAAGFGFARIEHAISSSKPPRLQASKAFLVIVLLLVSAEAWQPRPTFVPYEGVPAIYSRVAELPAPTLLAEMPFYPPEAIHENGEYVLNSTAHWQPLMNGYSGMTPGSYRRRAASFWFFPKDWAIDAIKAEGATHLMVHLSRFGNEASDVAATLDGRSDLRLLAADKDGRRLYEIRPPGNK